jgi:ribosomal protein L23
VKSNARGITRKKNWKKAYVTVAAGQEIDYMVSD